jgi:hypothetical protein
VQIAHGQRAIGQILFNLVRVAALAPLPIGPIRL